MQSRILTGLAVSIVVANTTTVLASTPLGTAFTYQGELRDAGAPADGDYDFVFRLFDADAGGAQVGADVPIDDCPVIGGLFTVELDFGASAFAGDARWLEIAVRPGASGDPHTVLSPRQPLTAAPYALFALNGSGGSDYWTLNGSGIHNTNAGYVGVGESEALAMLHVRNEDLLLGDAAIYQEEVVIEGTDSVMGLYSSPDGNRGSAITLAEVDAAGALVDKWGILRNTGPAGSAFAIKYGTNPNYSSNATLLVIESDGDTGIGTSSPQAKLHLASLSDVELILDADIDNATETDNPRVIFKQDGQQVVGRIGYRDGTNTMEIMQEYPNSLVLGAGNTDRVSIASNGDVNIGPDTLQVDPSTAFVGVNRSTRVTSAEYFGIQTPTGANEYGGMYVRTDSLSGLPFYGYSNGSGSAWHYWDGATLDWHLYNGGIQLTVTNEGRVGIGDTSPDANLDVPYTSIETGILVSGDGNRAVKGENTDALNGVTTGNLGEYYGGVLGSWEDSGSSDYAYGALGWSIPVAGVYAYTNSSAIDAAYLQGDVTVTGTLSKGGGAFKIDHPLDPENKYLYHSFVESPDMMNIYNGNVTTDANGVAVVTLPEWFEALNRDFRYQLTVVGQFAQAIVSEKVRDNRFTIRTDKPHVEVSWQVTGIRQDAFANASRIPVEEEKPAEERGKYLHPEAFGKSRDLEINHVDLSALRTKQN